MTRLLRIISGGQTGVDRAALDVALQLGLPCGGWCPQGRRSEDGSIPDRYPLLETPSPDYAERTLWNVRDSDGTLILTQGLLLDGTAFTRQCAQDLVKPYLVVDLAADPAFQRFQAWLVAHRIQVLNVAGPRESGCPGIYDQAYQWLLLGGKFEH